MRKTHQIPIKPEILPLPELSCPAVKQTVRISRLVINVSASYRDNKASQTFLSTCSPSGSSGVQLPKHWRGFVVGVEGALARPSDSPSLIKSAPPDVCNF